MKIAFIGLGNMGSGMCLNLIKAGHEVKVFDLDDAAVDAMAAAGGKTAGSASEASQDAAIIVTMLPAGKHVRSVYFGEGGVAGAAPAGALFIDCSTIAVDDARAASREASEAGFVMVDAPVSGGVAAAAAGALTFMVGGAREAFDRARPILELMGSKIVHAGDAGNGQAAKIANNMLLGVSMIATCEAFDLAQKLGLDAQSFFDIASMSSGQNWSMTSYCPVPGPVPAAPSNNDYAAGFAVSMMLKDLSLATDASDSVGAGSSFGRMAQSIYEALNDQGHGGKDFSVIMQHLDRSHMADSESA